MNIGIYKAGLEDLQEILQLQYLSYQSEAALFGSRDIPPLKQTLDEVIAEYNNGIILKMTDDHDVIIGSIRARESNGTVYIGKLMVHPDCRRNGYGTKLLTEIEKYYPNKRYELFTSTRSIDNIRLYQNLGYKMFDRKAITDELQFVYMEKQGFETMKKNDCMIRLEKKEDYREVENLIRESFWNVYRPGCYEHYVIYVLRDDPAFIKELDFVMEKDGRLIGQNMFMKTVINADDGRDIAVLTMGPICITPELKRKGYGKILLDYSLEKAAELGFGAVLFEGNIDFYGKSGFDFASRFNIRYHDLPEDADASFFLCRELIPGYLDGVTGVYQTPPGYYVDDKDVEAFDVSFPPKKKLKLPGQLF